MSKTTLTPNRHKRSYRVTWSSVSNRIHVLDESLLALASGRLPKDNAVRADLRCVLEEALNVELDALGDSIQLRREGRL